MEKTNFFSKIFKDKYKNPWPVKLFIVCLLILPLTAFGVFVVYGNFGGIIQAFQRARTDGKGGLWAVEFAGIDNFKEFFGYKGYTADFITEEVGSIISNSLGYLFVFMFISVPISIVTSFFLYKKVPFAKFIVVLLFMPNIMPLSVLAIYYRELLYDGAVLNTALSTLLNMPISMKENGNLLLYIYTVYFGFGYNAILIWGAMTRIPEEIVESANLDGANLFVEFWNITIPIIWPTLSMVIVLSWMVPFTVYSQPMMISSDKGNNATGTCTWSLYIMQKVKGGAVYKASALSLLSSLISLPTTMLLQKALEKVFPVVEV